MTQRPIWKEHCRKEQTTEWYAHMVWAGADACVIRIYLENEGVLTLLLLGSSSLNVLIWSTIRLKPGYSISILGSNIT